MQVKPLPENIRESVPFREFLNDLGALGVTQVFWGGVQFAVIAARSNPRWWLVPLDNRQAAAAGLEMLQPVTQSARLAKAVAGVIALFGPRSLLGEGSLRLSGLPDLGEAFRGRLAHVALFTGTDGPHRKTTMQVMDNDGAILGYAKLSRSPHVRHNLRNEADMLATVAKLNLSSVDIPQVLAGRDDEVVTLLVTDSLKSAHHTAPLALGSDHMAFLTELRRHTEHIGAKVLLDELTTTIQDRLGAFAAIAGPEWMARFARIEAILRPHADTIPLCLCHGDFTPWNTFMQSGRLYVFDWEYAKTDWPVGYDLTHFILSTMPAGVQLARLPRLIRTLADTQFDGNTVHACRALLLSLACHGMFYIGRLQDVGRPLDEWVDGPGRIRLIDRLLSQMDQG